MIYILYHSPCHDGFGAAYAAWKKFKNEAIYVPVNYGRDLPELPNATEVYILDFSYPKEVLIPLSEKCKVVVLDHHKTAEAQLSGLPFAQFDMKRSGAGMAWDYFHPTISRPWLINYIEDRDLWKHSLPHTHQINSAIGSYPLDFAVWDTLTEERVLSEGIAISRFKEILTDEMVRHHRLVNFLEYKDIPVVNASGSLVSDVGEALRQKYPKAPFVAVYYDMKGGGRKWSLRSSDSSEDVSQVAGRFGGGGHRNASGFIEKVPGEFIKLS